MCVCVCTTANDLFYILMHVVLDAQRTDMCTILILGFQNYCTLLYLHILTATTVTFYSCDKIQNCIFQTIRFSLINCATASIPYVYAYWLNWPIIGDLMLLKFHTHLLELIAQKSSEKCYYNKPAAVKVFRHSFVQ